MTFPHSTPPNSRPCGVLGVVTPGVGGSMIPSRGNALKLVVAQINVSFVSLWRRSVAGARSVGSVMMTN